MNTSAIENKQPHFFPNRLFDYALYCALLAFSLWLMFKTFSYDRERNLILLSPKIWSDFAATLPMIRSFSFGDNWPPEYPIFPGLPIQYHFLFFYLVGKLEQLGAPLHWALNVPSAIGFFAVLAMLYAIAKKLFNDVRIAILSVTFFLFNGSLSFIQYFAKHPVTTTSLTNFLSGTEFSAMGPWDGGKVLGVWHLNVFINQRHFGVALGLLMCFIFVCFWLRGRSKTTALTFAAIFGILIGFLPLFHKPVMLVFAITMSTFFFTLPYLRILLLTTGMIAGIIVVSLWLMSFNVTGPAQESISWYPGFTMHGDRSLTEVLMFLWYQFGLHCILVPIGMYFAPMRVKQAMIPAFLVFIIAFSLKFSPDVMANHKFINFSLIFMQMLSAYVIVSSYDSLKLFAAGRGRFLRPAAYVLSGVIPMALTSFLTVSGIIDFFAIFNDGYAGIADVGADEKAAWFSANTPPDTVVLNSSLLYHPASIAGRKVFVGWPYFTTTAGYDHDGRFEIVKAIYAGGDQNRICSLMRQHNIGFITVEDTSGNKDLPQINVSYFRDNFSPSYLSSDNKYSIFAVENICPLGARQIL